MSALLVLVIVLPPLLLLLGLGLGVAAARWWWARRAAALAQHQAADDEEAAATTAATIGVASAVPSSVALPPGRKASEAKLPRCIHVVASSASTQLSSIPSSTEAAAGRLAAAAAPKPPVAVEQAADQADAAAGCGRHAAVQPDGTPTGGLAGAGALAAGCDPLSAAEEQLRSLVGGSMGGSGSLSPGGPMGHHKAGSMDLGTLVRAGPSVISQVMEDWDARSTLYRLMSGMEQLGAPGSPVATASLLSPAAALFSPQPGGTVAAGGPPSMPPGEVHMDEIDLIECIGKGGYGCVYKASWRGAGVAVKYIKCPTDDSDSLGRAIREVVLSKKMSHPNVVQCYSWTVLTEPDAGRCPSSYSGHTSPREQSFTSRPGSSRVFKLSAGRGSLELLRPGSAPQQGGTPDSLRLNGVRRGLDMRFNAAAGVTTGLLRGGGSPTSLHRITERLAQEAEEPPAGSARRGGSTELIAELVAEAAEEHGLQPSQLAGCSSAARSAQQLAQEDAELLAAGKPSPLKVMHAAPANSSSPGSSPGIQAVHATPHSSSSPAVGFAPSARDGEESSLPSPEHRQEAVSVEPASLPSSPFASRAVQSRPLRHTSSSSGEAHASGSRRRSSGSGGPQQPSVPPACGAAASGAMQQQTAQQQAAQQQDTQQQTGLQQETQLPAVQVQPQQTSETDEGEDVYARFGSYDEMVAHFRRLAAEGQQQQGGEGEAAVEEQQAGPSLPAGGARCGSLPRGLNEQDLTVTAASSFSDVLSTNGFMLEGSSAELAVLSQPSSPRHQQQPGQQLRSGASSWFVPSAASSRPATPRSATALAAASSLVPWQSQQLVQQQASQQPSRFSRAASAAVRGSSAAGTSSLPHAVSLPQPAWPATEEQAPAAVAGCEQQQADSVQQRSSQDGPGGQTRATRRCSSTMSLSGWHVPAEAAASAVLEAEASSSMQQDQPAVPQQQQQQGTGDVLVASGSNTLPAAAAWAPGYIAAAVAASAPAKQQQQPEPPCVSVGGCRSGAPSGTVTPRLCSLSNLATAGAAADGSVQVTPRAHSLRMAASQQLSPRADSVRSAGRSPGSAGLQRLEELREEAAASADRLSLGSQDHSFNSEEGFGSPVKQRCGGVKDVFALEELQLSGQEALMVVVMEYCDLGSLRKALQRKAFRPSAKWPFQTTYRALLRTAQEIAKGMGYIHEFNIVHGDLKPGNVLLKTHKVDRRGYIAKVSDFGLSRPLDMEDTHTIMGSALGTIAYSAPETFLHNKLKKPSDVYAFGIMLWEMFYCTEPYENLIDGQICLGVSDGALRPEFRDDCPEPYRRLAERCWHQVPGRRPTFEEIDRELVRIEMEFRLHRHRAASKRASSAHSAGAAAGSGSQGGGSLPASRPGSPDVAPRAGGAAPDPPTAS